MEKPLWRRRSSVYVIESPYLRLRKDVVDLPDGTSLDEYYIRESLGYAVIFPLTDAGEVVMVRQYRYGADRVTLELPTGAIDTGETPLACAQRELAEETGYTASRWEELIALHAEPVRSDALMHAFIAFDARQTQAQHLDPTEVLEPETFSCESLVHALDKGEIGSVASLAVIHAALARLRISAF
jgi:ADP-ribose pyrophosphatase